MNPQEEAIMNTADEQDMSLRELEERLDQELAELQNETVSEEDEAEYQNVHRSLQQLELTYHPGEGYQYRFPDGDSVIMTVPDGARSSQPVKIDNVSELLIIRVQKDGEDVLFDLDGIYEEPGEYSVFLESLSINDSEKTITDYDASLKFSIAGNYRTEASGIKAPQGMVIRNILKNGSPVTAEKNARTAKLTADGVYRILYESETDSSIQYTEEFILDTEAPVLQFSEDITAEDIYAPVRITCDEPGVTVTIFKDGVELPLTESGITYGGTYLVRAQDPAGNTADYDIRVKYGKKNSGMIWILISVSLILILVIGIIYIRKHREIR